MQEMILSFFHQAVSAGLPGLARFVLENLATPSGRTGAHPLAGEGLLVLQEYEG
jgi:hypothetical protein